MRTNNGHRIYGIIASHFALTYSRSLKIVSRQDLKSVIHCEALYVNHFFFLLPNSSVCKKSFVYMQFILKLFKYSISLSKISLSITFKNNWSYSILYASKIYCNCLKNVCTSRLDTCFTAVNNIWLDSTWFLLFK